MSGSEQDGGRPRRRAPVDGGGRASGRPDAIRAAEASDEATNRLLSVAHELGNLVDGALRTVDLARRGLSELTDDPEQDQAAIGRRLDAAHDALARMAGLLHETMRPRSGRALGAHSTHAPLIEAILHAAEVHRPLAEDHGVEMSIECSPRLVLTPAGSMYTVLANAIRNAIESLAATGRGGRIEIVAELATNDSDQAEIRIDVLDDGPGPPSTDDDRLFSSGYTTKDTGLGVGLSLCREIVSEMQGSVTLRRRRASDDVHPADRGARFSVRYPAPIHLHQTDQT